MEMMKRKFDSAVPLELDSAGIRVELPPPRAETEDIPEDVGVFHRMVGDLIINDFDDPAFTFPGSFEVVFPKAFASTAIAQSVWSRWYGSRRAAEKVESILRGVRDAVPTKVHKLTRNLAPLMFLNFAFGNVNARIGFQEAMDHKQYDAIKPESRVEAVYDELAAKFGHVTPGVTAHNGSIVELARLTEQAWPFMKEIHELGYFRDWYCERLLKVDHLCRIIESGAIKAPEITLAEMAINVILGGLMPRFSVLAGIHRKAVANSFHGELKFAGVTGSSLNAGESIWRQIDTQELENTCRHLVFELMSLIEREGASAWQAKNIALDQQEMAGKIVQGAFLGRALDKMYRQVCRSDNGTKLYGQLRELIENCTQRLELDVDKAMSQFPPMLAGQNLDLEHVINMPQAFKALADFDKRNDSAARRVDEALAQDIERSERFTDIQNQLLSLAANTSLASIKTMGRVADEAADLIEQSRDWLHEELLPAATKYVDNWRMLYASVQAMPRTTDQPVIPEPAPVEKEKLALPMPASREEVDLSNKLQTALADNRHLSRELEDARRGIHRLRTQMAGKIENQAENIGFESVDALDSINRIALRQGFGPVDVLAYFEATTRGRVQILSSAWNTASQYTLPYEPAERMLEVLANLVGPYLDALRDGQSDAKARNRLGGKVYSAKESDTTMSNARLRAMREFAFEGEKRLFVQHLRISNAGGMRGMRIYFAVEGADQDKRIVIAYVGPHLEVAMSS